MKNKVTKKVTIDDLAIMVAKGFEAVDKRFNDVDKRFNAVDKRLDDVEESIATTNNNVLNLGDRTVLKFEFDKLVTRVVRLERKTKA